MSSRPVSSTSVQDARGFQRVGPLTGLQREGTDVTLSGAAARLHLALLSDAVVRVRLLPGEATPVPFSYALDAETEWPGPASLAIEESEAAIRIETPGLTVRVERTTGRLTFSGPAGQVLLEDAFGAAWTAPGSNGQPGAARVALSTRLRPGERLLGLGDKPLALDRRGHRVEHWNTDAFRYARGTDPLYKSIPFVLGLHDGGAYGLFVDHTARMTFDLGADAPDRLRVEAPGETLTYYILAGPAPLDVVQRFARLTGCTPMLPRWALGYHQSRYSYRSEAEIRAIASELRTRALPCDALYFDIHHMDGFRVFTWDRAAFPDPAALLADLRADGFRSIVIVDPGVKCDDPDYGLVQDGLDREAFVTHPDGAPFVGKVWPGLCHFPDFTDPDVRAWWGDLHADLLTQGVAGVWNDMNEPAVFIADLEEATAITMPDDLRHAYEGRGADHAEVHNVYGMQMLRATYEGLRRLAPDTRPFTITRAAYAGTQRYGTAWTGDNTSTWDHLRLAAEQCLSLNVCAFPFVGSDVGGFIGEPDGELMARWTQLGALTPLFRNHADLDAPHQEPWCFGEEVERVCREAIELRYRLLPYLYTVLWEAAHEGLPMMRPLALHHPHDETIRQADPLGFYVGGSLLAYPVFEPGQARADVYLPERTGGWFDFHTGQSLAEQTHLTVETPLDRFPLFVPAGSVLPLQPVLQHTGERPVERLTLHVYPAPGAFAARLYEDAGDGWAFLQGDHWLGTLYGTDDGRSIRLHAETAGHFSPSWTSWEVVVHGVAEAPSAVLVDGEATAFTHAVGTVRFATTPGAAFEVRR